MGKGEAPVKAVIYARVSTDMQDPENQIPVLKAWASQMRFGFYGEGQEALEITEVYQESETAWQAGHQKKLNQLLQNAARGKFRVVLVWSLDRLSRLGPPDHFQIMGKLSRFGVQVWSYQEAWTLSPTRPEFDLMLAMTAYISRGESTRRSERTKLGIARKRLEAGPRRRAGSWGRQKGTIDTKKRKRRGD